MAWFTQPMLLSNDIERVAVARNADGRLEAFVKSKDGDLYHKWQTTTDAAILKRGEGWSHPVDNAAKLSLNIDDFAVHQNSDGRLEVFIIGGDGDLYHKWQSDLAKVRQNMQRRDIDGDPLARGWSHAIPNSAKLSLKVSQVAVGRNLDGRLEVFLIGKDDDLYHKWQLDLAKVKRADVDGDPLARGWSHAIPNSAKLSLNVDKLAVSQNADGRLEVFLKGKDEDLYHKWQSPPLDLAKVKRTDVDGDPLARGWSHAILDAARLGTQVDQLAIGRTGNGKLEVFVIRSSDEHLDYASQTSPGGAWIPLTGPIGGKAEDVAAATNRDGQAVVFWTSKELAGFIPPIGPPPSPDLPPMPPIPVHAGRHLYVAAQQADGGWKGQRLGVEVDTLVVGQNADGRLELFMRRIDNEHLYHIWEM